MALQPECRALPFPPMGLWYKPSRPPSTAVMPGVHAVHAGLATPPPSLALLLGPCLPRAADHSILPLN